MRALLLVGLAVLFAGCSKSEERLGRRREAEATPEQVAALHAGNERLAARVNQYIQETKKTPANLDEVKTWAGARWDVDDDRALSDPWGNRVLLNVQLSSTGHALTLRSWGPDGKTSDDDLKYDSRDKATKTEEQRSGK
jgi:hypothetical protein